jgi:hypothetical protein
MPLDTAVLDANPLAPKPSGLLVARGQVTIRPDHSPPR